MKVNMKRFLCIFFCLICLFNCEFIYAFAQTPARADITANEPYTVAESGESGEEVSEPAENTVLDGEIYAPCESTPSGDEEVPPPSSETDGDEQSETNIFVKSIKRANPANKTIELGVNQTRQVSITVQPASAKKYIAWSVENKKIAGVSATGLIRAKKAGNTTVTAKATDDSKKSITYTLKVSARRKGNYVNTNSCNIVKTKKSKYTYEQLCKDILSLQKKYPDIFQYKSVGKSYDKRNVYELIIGNKNSKRKIFVQATVHAREYVNSMLVMKQVEALCENYYKGAYRSRYYNELLQNCCFYIIPMANPDGVSISIGGARSIRNKSLSSNLVKMQKKYGKGKASYFTRWKANARGVDLNRNWGCNWKKYLGLSKRPASEDYKCPSAFSEKETKILKKEVERLKPKIVISYHSYGSIIYWDFAQKGTLQRKCSDLFKVAGKLTGYRSATSSTSRPVKVSNLYPCFGDWVASHKKTPTLTIETGRVPCPIPIKYFNSIWKENKHLLPALAYFALNDTTINFSSLKSNKKGFTATAKKYNSNSFSYQIAYTKSAKMANEKYAECPAKKGAVKISGLSAKRKYYVRIRTVKTYGSVKIYGKWSKVKTVKIKA